MTDKEKKNELAIVESEITDTKEFEKLTPYEQTFVIKYSETPNLVKAVEQTRKEYKIPANGKFVNSVEYEGQSLLAKPEIKKAVDKMREIKTQQTEFAIAETGVKISEIFSVLSTDTKDLERINTQIDFLDKEMAAAMGTGDTSKYLTLQTQQMNLIRLKDKREDTVRKNLQLATDATGLGKTKVENKISSLVVNLGTQTINNGTKTEEHLRDIESEDVIYNDEDILDIDEI